MTDIMSVPLSKLVASDANMRRTARETGILVSERNRAGIDPTHPGCHPVGELRMDLDPFPALVRDRRGFGRQLVADQPIVLRDLFSDDQRGGYLEDVDLLNGTSSVLGGL